MLRRKLHLLVLDCEPWRRLLPGSPMVRSRAPGPACRHFALSSLQTSRMRSYARSNGIAVTHYVYEASRRPMEAIEALFRRLDIAALSSGRRARLERTRRTRIRAISHQLPQIAAAYVVPGLHSSETQYSYKSRDTGNLSEADRGLVSDLALPQLYQESVTACIRDLGFDRALSAAMFGPKLSRPHRNDRFGSHAAGASHGPEAARPAVACGAPQPRAPV